MILGSQLHQLLALMAKSDAEALESCLENLQSLTDNSLPPSTWIPVREQLLQMRMLAERACQFYRGFLQVATGETETYSPQGLGVIVEGAGQLRWEA